MTEFSGTVIHGEKIGRTLGYPTANIDISQNDLVIDAGVYASLVSIGERQYQGALVILSVPWKVEVYIIDMPTQDLYGQILSVTIKQKISDIANIGSLDALKDKIAHDVMQIKDYFSSL